MTILLRVFHTQLNYYGTKIWVTQAFFAMVKNRWEKQQSSYFLSRIIQRSEANGFSDSPGMLCSIFICFHVTWGKNTFLFVTVCNKSKKREKSDMLQHRSNIVLKVQQGTRLYLELSKKDAFSLFMCKERSNTNP